MKRKSYTGEQIIGMLKEHEAGLSIDEVVRKHGVAYSTFHRWKSKYSGLEVSDARRVRGLESENTCLKKLLAVILPH